MTLLALTTSLGRTPIDKHTSIAQAYTLAIAYGLTAIIDAPYLVLHHRNTNAWLRFEHHHISLTKLEVTNNHRQMGSGSTMLNHITKIADAVSLELQLMALSTKEAEKPGLDQSQLVAWYRRNGFIGTDFYLRRLPSEETLDKAA